MKCNGDSFRVTQAKIDRIVRRIVTRFHPEKIILFGSWVSGGAGLDSDIDILVVMPYAGLRRAKQIELRNAIQRVPCAKDVIVAAPEELIHEMNIPGAVIRSAVEEGKVVYERRI